PVLVLPPSSSLLPVPSLPPRSFLSSSFLFLLLLPMPPLLRRSSCAPSLFGPHSSSHRRWVLRRRAREVFILRDQDPCRGGCVPDQKLPHTGDAEEEDADLALEMRDLSLSVGGEGEGRISSYWLRFEVSCSSLGGN
ncbi:unnamed protein product, partial [Urochloa humidicola]